MENRTQGTILAERAALAKGFRRRLAGLRNRSSMEKGEALILQPCAGLHTFGMRFPIDIVLLDQRHRVLDTFEAVPPGRLATLHWCHAAIELPAGIIRRSRTQRGDHLSLAPGNSA